MGFLKKLFGNSSQYEFELVKFKDDQGGNGYIVRRLEDGKKLSWRGLPKRDGLQAMNVAGVNNYPKTLQHKSFAPGNQITLKPEPDNPHDPDAIAVYDQSGKHHIGYLYREDCPRIHEKMKEGFGCISMWETVKQRKRVGLRILFIEGKALAKIKGVNG